MPPWLLPVLSLVGGLIQLFQTLAERFPFHRIWRRKGKEEEEEESEDFRTLQPSDVPEDVPLDEIEGWLYAHEQTEVASPDGRYTPAETTVERRMRRANYTPGDQK